MKSLFILQTMPQIKWIKSERIRCQIICLKKTKRRQATRCSKWSEIWWKTMANDLNEVVNNAIGHGGWCRSLLLRMVVFVGAIRWRKRMRISLNPRLHPQTKICIRIWYPRISQNSHPYTHPRIFTRYPKIFASKRPKISEISAFRSWIVVLYWIF